MVLPQHPVTLTAAQIAALQQALTETRHDINNHLALLLAAVELIRSKPEMHEELTTTALEQLGRIKQALQEFSAEFEKAHGIKRD